MKKYISSLLFLFIFGFSFSLVSKEPASGEMFQDRLEPRIVEAEGIVVENLKACVVDGPCILRVMSEREIISINYTAPRGKQCINKPVSDFAFGIKTGDKIRVRGISNGRANVSICDSKDYFLELID